MKKRYSSLLATKGGQDLSGSNLPWLDTPSIYDHITWHIDRKSGRLSRTGRQLPDEQRRFSGIGLRWLDGALDGAGILSQPMTPEEASQTAGQVADYILTIAGTSSIEAKIALYKILLQDNLIAFIDEALQEIASLPSLPAPALREFALFLAKNSPDRGPVKFAIALLGMMADRRDISLVMCLGLHEELTLYSVVALGNMLDDPEQELWSLAKRVNGWGRIHAVERLASTGSAEIKDWLLRTGYRNRVMNEYLAYHCAVGGGLRDALLAPGMDDELLRAAGEIIDALLAGGPAEDINDYADAAEVILRYLELLVERAADLHQFLVVDSILGYLSDNWDAEERSRNGWDAARRDRAIVLANQVLGKPCWREMAKAGLVSDDRPLFHLALKAAGLLGIDTWARNWERLNEHPLDGECWYLVMQCTEAEKIDQVLALALHVLPLEKLASGPADELGMGPDYEMHRCLESIVQHLGPFPGKGWPLVSASLRSPVVRSRHLALEVLEVWGRDCWPDDAARLLREALELEPAQDLKERIESLLRPP